MSSYVWLDCLSASFRLCRSLICSLYFYPFVVSPTLLTSVGNTVHNIVVRLRIHLRKLSRFNIYTVAQSVRIIKPFGLLFSYVISRWLCSPFRMCCLYVAIPKRVMQSNFFLSLQNSCQHLQRSKYMAIYIQYKVDVTD